MKFRKKPVIIDADRWMGHNKQIVIPDVKEYDPYGEKAEFCKHCGKTMKEHGWIATLEGGHIVCPLDWVITGVAGEKYPCKPDIFEKTYERVGQSHDVEKYFED